MVFNKMNISPIVEEVFGEACESYPGSNYNMLIANSLGVFKYTEEFIASAKVKPALDERFILTEFDMSLQDIDDKVYFSSVEELKGYLIKTNNLMGEQFRKCLSEASNNAVDLILKVLD